MLALFGRDAAIKNIYRLAKLEHSDGELNSISEIRQVYLNFLDKHQRGIASNRADDIFTIDRDVEDGLRAAFQDGHLNDLGQANIVGDVYCDTEARRKKMLARRALIDLFELDADFAIVFALAIHSVFVRPSRPAPGRLGTHGGSSSASIGAIWLTVDDKISLIDLQEMYVHELTHHLLFIDELNNPQFNYKEIAKPENYARSAILRRNRPLDKVVHSIVVASEILLARTRFIKNKLRTGIHPCSENLAKDTLEAIASVDALENRTELMTPHLLAIVDACRDACARHQESTNVCFERNS